MSSQKSNRAERINMRRTAKAGEGPRTKGTYNTKILTNNQMKVKLDKEDNSPQAQKLRKTVKRQAPPGFKAAMISIAEPNQELVIPVQCIPVNPAFAAAVLGAMQQAISMGFEDYAELNTSSLNGATYYAYVFMTQILFSYVTNTTSQTIKVPQWLDVLGCALVQTEVPFVQGKLSYSFITSMNYPTSLSPSVPALGDYEFYLWQNNIALGLLNGYSCQGLPTAYDVQLGQMAYNLLVKFTSNLDVFPGWKGVDQLTSWTLKDVSAFAVSFLQLGQSTNNVGSPLVEIDFEVPINAPDRKSVV